VVSACRLLAIRYRFEGSVSTSALPQKADLKPTMSAFSTWKPALPATSDVLRSLPVGQKMTRSGHRGRAVWATSVKLMIWLRA
jgi:hypothetical protein